jgi:hypothetical protein
MERLTYFKNELSGLVFTSLFVLLVSPGSAYAYLDPGTGSYVLQILIATVFGAWFSIKLFGKRLKAFLRNLFSKDKEK